MIRRSSCFDAAEPIRSAVRLLAFFFLPVLLGAQEAPSSPPDGASEKALEPSFLAAERIHLAEREDLLADAVEPAERIPLLLETGRHDEALAAADALLEGSIEDRLLASRAFFAVHAYDRIDPLLAGLEAEVAESGIPNEGVRKLRERRWALRGEVGLVAEAVEKRLAEDPANLDDRAQKASLAFRRFGDDAAEAVWNAILEETEDDGRRATALHGLAKIRHRRLDFDAAWELLLQARELRPGDPDTLMLLAQVLIRRQERPQAIAVMEHIVRIAPSYRYAHSLLGSGHARFDYTELTQQDPQVFVAAQGEVRAGSEAYLRGDDEEALHRFRRALEISPHHGRAHKGIAVVLMLRILRQDHRAAERERRFAAAKMPEIPGIEEFVLNWEDLNDVYRKHVAVLIAPWKHYLPALRKAGGTLYIQPLHELHSQAPHQARLRDKRTLDGRLWDDVGGSGGLHLVTGVESLDYARHEWSNILLHELSHQIHLLLAEKDRARIEELYARAVERREAGEVAFVSRYAGTNVKEYFAVAADAVQASKRDRWDVREVVRERLFEIDPEFATLMQRLLTEPPPQASPEADDSSKQTIKEDPGAAPSILPEPLHRSPAAFPRPDRSFLPRP